MTRLRSESARHNASFLNVVRGFTIEKRRRELETALRVVHEARSHRAGADARRAAVAHVPCRALRAHPAARLCHVAGAPHGTCARGLRSARIRAGAREVSMFARHLVSP